MEKRSLLDRTMFDNEDQVKAYLTNLKKGILPLKFGYLGPAAHTHDLLVQSPEYGLADAESALMREKFRSHIWPLLTTRYGLNIVDVGSGNGLKALRFMELTGMPASSICYLGLDYSAELSSIARSNLLQSMPQISVVTSQVDFESGAFPQVVDSVFPGRPCVFLFLGTTLGNSIDREQVLRNISASMRPDDVMLVGLELYDSTRIDDILVHYLNDPFYKAVFNCVTFAGVTTEDGQLRVYFNNQTRNVEVGFQFNKDIIVETSPDESMRLRNGETILIFVSHRFDEDEIKQIFPDARLSILEIIHRSDGAGSVLVACQKQRE